ncbi:MAG: DUF4111 domain-containing protein [bacterium]|nr:DUF4111 domain-containing protein [bacterium]
MASNPQSIEELLQDIVRGFQNLLGDNLVGVYLHGSLAMDSFHPLQSDVDFLVIVKEKPSNETKQKVADFLIKLSDEAPPKGLEMSIVLQKYLDQFIYPTPFEFHFGKEHISKYQAGTVNFNEVKTDKDLAAHFVVTRERGRALFGPDPKETFPVVPPENYLDSLMEDIEWFKHDIAKTPIYGILNLCRVLAYAQDKLITSKVEGGRWALKNVDAKYHEIIKRGLSAYESEEQINRPWDKKELEEFADYMIKQITNHIQ